MVRIYTLILFSLLFLVSCIGASSITFLKIKATESFSQCTGEGISLNCEKENLFEETESEEQIFYKVQNVPPSFRSPSLQKNLYTYQNLDLQEYYSLIEYPPEYLS